MKTKLFVLSVVAAVGVFVCTSVFAEDIFKDTSEGYLSTPKRPMMARPFAHKIAQSQAKYINNAKEPYEGDSPGKKPVTPEVPRIEENHVLPSKPVYIKDTVDKGKELLDMIKERIATTDTNAEKIDDYKQGLKVGEVELYDSDGNLGAKENYLDGNGVPDKNGRIQSSIVYGPGNAGNKELEGVYDYRQDLRIGNVELYDRFGALGAIENYLDGKGIPDKNGHIQSVTVYDGSGTVKAPPLPQQDPKVPALPLRNSSAAIRGDTDLAARLTVINTGRPQLPPGCSISGQIVMTRTEEVRPAAQRQ